MGNPYELNRPPAINDPEGTTHSVEGAKRVPMPATNLPKRRIAARFATQLSAAALPAPKRLGSPGASVRRRAPRNNAKPDDANSLGSARA
jgi:hypothetical protein